MKDKEFVGIKEMRCPICGKVFAVVCAERWTYKRKTGSDATIYYCSYGCTLKADREREEKTPCSNGRRAQQRAKMLEKGMYIDTMHKNGMTYEDIADKLGMALRNVHRVYDEYKNYKSKCEV